MGKDTVTTEAWPEITRIQRLITILESAHRRDVVRFICRLTERICENENIGLVNKE